MENDNVIKIEPIDTSVGRKGYYFFMSLFIGAGVSVLMLLEYWKTLGIGIVILTFPLGFVVSYLMDRVTPIRKTFNFLYNGIVVTDEKIVQYGYYPGNAFNIPRTIPRSEVYDCYLKVNTRAKSANPLQDFKTWFFWTPKRLILLGENGKKIATIDVSPYSEEDIQKLTSALQAKSLQ